MMKAIDMVGQRENGAVDGVLRVVVKWPVQKVRRGHGSGVRARRGWSSPKRTDV
jgi:hypothetical protein